MITMPDTVINKVNILGKYQQELLGFTDCTGQLIGYGDFEFTGADGEGGENEVPLKIKSWNDLNYQEYQEEVNPDQKYQIITQKPVKVELETLE